MHCRCEQLDNVETSEADHGQDPVSVFLHAPTDLQTSKQWETELELQILRRSYLSHSSVECELIFVPNISKLLHAASAIC